MRTAQREIIRRVICLLLAVFLLGTEAVNGTAAKKTPDYELGVRCDRQITALNERQRSFRLEYQVWSEDWVSQEAQPCRLILLLERSGETSSALGPAGLEKTVREFLTEFGKLSPRSRAGVVLFGGETVSTVPLTALDSRGIDTLTAPLTEPAAAAEKKPDYAEALRQARELVQEEESPLYLITLTAGDWWEEGTEALTELQKLRGFGARSYTVSLCGSPEQEAEDFWQSMSSAPLSTHHYLCPGDPVGCFAQIRRDVAAVISVEVVERLDPRFTLTQSEQIRLHRAGAHLTSERDGAWEISWEVPLPRNKDDPWKTALTIQAKAAFPGGNDVPVDREGSGVYRAGGEIFPFSPCFANVPLALRWKDRSMDLFLGERIKTVYKKQNLEELLLDGPGLEWFGKGKTGQFSYFWETEGGAPIGTLKQLGALRPEQDSAYRLRVTFRPDSPGLFSAGKSVETAEKTARLSVKVTSGTLRVRAVPGEGTELDSDSSVLFLVKGDNGVEKYCTARAEADPEGADPQHGGIFLEGELTGLPFGVYMVLPLSGTAVCAEPVQICRLGVWEQDDTVSPGRNFARAVFTLNPS